MKRVTVSVLAGIVAIVGVTTSAEEASDAASGETVRIYAEYCAACHTTGVGGAPKPGSRVDWESRMKFGIEGLYLSAIEGLPPQMPQRGACFECSDDDLEAVVDFMMLDQE